jgi:hypothetical protein
MALDTKTLMQNWRRGSREALAALPIAILIGWLSPQIYSVQVTAVRAACALVAIAVGEAVVPKRWPPVERELVVIALGLAVSVMSAALFQLFFPQAVS